MDMISVLDYRRGAKIPTRLRIKRTQLRGLMRITSASIHSTVYIGYYDEDEENKIEGTAFCISRKIPGLDRSAVRGLTTRNFIFVTAKHIIEGIPKEIDIVRLRLNVRDGNAEWIPTRREDWIHNPNTDVSVYLWSREKDGDLADYEVYVIPEEMHATKPIIEEHAIGVGDEVITVGLFTKHPGEQKNHPIIRVGNIAAFPDDKIMTELSGLVEAYLVEIRSIGGLSGSPVFVHLGGELLPDGFWEIFASFGDAGKEDEESVPIEIWRQLRIMLRNPYSVQDTIYLLGVMHGHFPIDEHALGDTACLKKESKTLNTGIAIVIPIDHVWDTLKTGEIAEALQEIEDVERKKVLPVMDSARDKTEGNGITKTGFEDTLKKVSKPQLTKPQDIRTSE